MILLLPHTLSSFYRSNQPGRILITLILIMFFTGQSKACLNEYRTKISGRLIDSDAYFNLPYHKSLDKQELESDLKELSDKYKIDNSIKTLSDFGVALIYLGRYTEAIKIYKRIEKQKPGLYATAANLGTAYELIGQNDSAFHYIKRAISLEPNSHAGSEWIHLKILEAKEKIAKDPDYLSKNSVIGLDFGNESKPLKPKEINLENLERQIIFQLRERMTFIKPKDVIMGQILFDLGNITAFTHDVQTALEAYKLAKQYGYTSFLLEKRIWSLTLISINATILNNALEFPVLALGIFCLIGAGTIWFVIKIISLIKEKAKTNSIKIDSSNY